MKKINSILTMLLLAAALPASAQLAELDRYVVETIGAATSEITEGQWYLVYNTRVSVTAGGGYWWDAYYDLETGSGTGTLYMSYGPDVVFEGQTAADASPYLVRFIAPETPTGDGQHPEYYAQFGTGNYLQTPNSSTSGTSLSTADNIYDANTLYAYLITDEQDGNWAFNTTDAYDMRIDNNGTGEAVVIWESGDLTTEGGNNDWYIYPVTLRYVEDDLEWAQMELETVYSTYIDYVGYFPTEGQFAYYDAEAVAAFEAAVEAAAAIDGPDAGSFTAEDMNAMAQAIIDTYAAVIASYVPRAATIEDGYYFLNNALDFYQTETTEGTEDPETGDIIPGETITTHYVKGMYSEADSEGEIYALWATQEYTAPYLWHVTSAGNNTYSVVNAATGATFDNVSTSTNVTMTVDGTNVMIFDQVIPEDADTINLAIRVSTQAEDDYYYLHCGGHSSGAGVSGNIVGWNNTADASMWKLIAISDEEAEELLAEYNSSDEKRWSDAQEVIADAQTKMKIAEDVLVGTEGLITSVDQLYSPYTEPTEGEGEKLDYMIDGDASTFWHSVWTEGDYEDGEHYFQVELPEDESELVFTFTRRSSNSDHITLWGVYGTNDANAGDAEEDCTLIAQISTPFSSSGETLTSDVFDATGYKYLRFYEDEKTASSGTGFFHVAEFQLYTVTLNPTSQMVEMGDTYTNLESAIAAAQTEGTANAGLSENTYNALMTAYNAFIAVFVDPTELRTALSDANLAVGSIVTGTDPGYWTSSDTSLGSTITEATAYDAAGKYTQAESDSYVESLTTGIDNLMASANTIQEGKWYRIHYATQEVVEENVGKGEWSTSVAVSESYGNLYGQYVCVANNLYDEEGTWEGIEAVGQNDAICVGQNLHFVDDIDILDADAAKFRFVAVGDTAYMIQNKSTGLFIRAAGESGAVTLSPHPTLFNVSAIGYGENIISGVTTDGEVCNNLHAQQAYRVLVTWAANTPGTNSGMYIEDCDEAVASDYDGTDFNIAIVDGAVNMFCFGTGVTANEGTMYGVQDVDGTTITLKQIENNTAEPGQPFVFIYGDTDAYDADAEEEAISFSHDYTVAAKAKDVGRMAGVYYGYTIGQGKAMASGNTIAVTKTSSSYVDDNSAYLISDFDLEDVLTVVIEEGTFDSIEEAVAAAAQDGNIYTLDGKLVGKGNLNKVKTLGKGIYILNGAKILVK
ncbi:MAG: hypothetical protein LUC86_04055 [Prevotellaceae bacterium]|nr:hypothetical protein [Prevotellaceae bacterium]